MRFFVGVAELKRDEKRKLEVETEPKKRQAKFIEAAESLSTLKHFNSLANA
jgi:hypothetical protein